MREIAREAIGLIRAAAMAGWPETVRVCVLVVMLVLMVAAIALSALSLSL